MVKKMTVFALCVWGIFLFVACRLYLKIPLYVLPGDEMLRYAFFANVTCLMVTVGVLLPFVHESEFVKKMTVRRMLCRYREYLIVSHLLVIMLVGLTQQVIRHAWSFSTLAFFLVFFFAGCQIAFFSCRHDDSEKAVGRVQEHTHER